MDNIAKTFQDMVPKFQYRDLEWIERLEPPIGFFDDFVIGLPGFYAQDGKANEGVCSELVAKAYQEILQVHPELHKQGRIHRVGGADPVYFGFQGEGHTMIAITDKQVMDRNSILTDTAAKQALLEGNAILFDPSFGFTGQLEGSDYKIDTIMSPDYPINQPAGTAIFETYAGGGRPGNMHILGKGGDTIVALGLYYISSNPTEGLNPGFKFIHPHDSPNIFYDTDHPDVDAMKKDIPGLEKVVDHINKIMRTAQPGSNLSEHRKYIVTY